MLPTGLDTDMTETKIRDFMESDKLFQGIFPNEKAIFDKDCQS